MKAAQIDNAKASICICSKCGGYRAYRNGFTACSCESGFFGGWEQFNGLLLKADTGKAVRT